MAATEEERGTWSGRLDFTFSALSFAVGMGNLWRFPYLCYRNGGGAFLIPYVISMVLAGYPLMLLELALGQFAGKGIVAVWKSCPIFEGIGWGMLSVSVFTGLYYNMIVAWCFFYMFASFGSDVPWRTCDNAWNTPDCVTGKMKALERNCTVNGGLWVNNTCLPQPEEGFGNPISLNFSRLEKKSPEDEFFNNYMLDVSDGFHEPGMIRWQLALCFLLCWLIVLFALAKGIRVSGKVTYVTALCPYVILSILLVRGLTLDGSMEGILYYVTPQWHRLLSAKVWADAAIQAFFSLSICWGGLVSLASFNKFSNDCVRDAIVVATGDMLTSIFGGFVIFAFLGYMANEIGLPVGEVATQGPGLAFIVYPEAVTKLPYSPVWSVLFMLMLINIGIGSQMGLVSTIHTTLLDQFPKKLGQGKRPILLLLCLCAAGFLFGLLLTTRGGIYYLLLMDTYAATYALLFLAFVECIAIGWVYGFKTFYGDIEQMLGRTPSQFWQICWRFVDPVLIVFITVFIFLDFSRSAYRDYVFPTHWELMGWGISLVSMAMVPLIAIIKVCRLKGNGSIVQKIKLLSKPDDTWGPGNTDKPTEISYEEAQELNKDYL